MNATRTRPVKSLIKCILTLAAIAAFPAFAPAQTNCYPPPSGIVGWWPLNGDFTDLISGNTGLPFGTSVFTNGESGQALFFDGGTNYVRVPAATALNAGAGAGVTIETWVKPLDLVNPQPLVEWNSGTNSYSSIGTHLWLNVASDGGGTGSIWVNFIDASLTPHALSTAPGVLAANVFQHIAATYDKGSGAMKLYLNGVTIAQTNYGSFYPNTTSDLYLGLRPAGGGGPQHLHGILDEPSIYTRALALAEIRQIFTAGSSGKCEAGFPPYITQEPANASCAVGATASFKVDCGGSPTLAFAWKYSSNSATIGTNATLTLTNVQKSQAGQYYVQISNSYGATNSSNATLTVTNPPALVRLASTNSAAANVVPIPVTVVANGNENGLSFSVSYSSSSVSFAGAVLGSPATGGFLSINTNSVGSGLVGIQVLLPPNTTLNPGTQDVVHVLFKVASVLNGADTSLTFIDSPTIRAVTDVQASPLPATYANGGMVVAAATALEGDVYPRPAGDKVVSLSDWLVIGPFAAGLASATNSGEFQRADCAPRSTGGDGQITTCDWVQAGRYANGLDPATPIGGPVSPGTNTSAGPSPTRIVSVADSTILQGNTGSLSIMLAAQGNENALGFSVAFDPTQYAFSGAGLGSAISNGVYILNTNNAGAGRLGVLVALPSGSALGAGPAEVFKINLQALPGSTDATTSTLSFGDQPVFREISDAFGIAQPASYTNATLTTHPPRPTLNIAPSGTNVVLTWPLWATNFGLSVANAALPPASTWSNLNLVLTVGPSNVSVTLTNDGATNFFRLHNP